MGRFRNATVTLSWVVCGGFCPEAAQEFAAPSQRRFFGAARRGFWSTGAERTLVREQRSAQHPRRMAGAVECLPSLCA
jgi:hypothetical protein